MKSYAQEDLARGATRSRAADLLLKAPLIQGTLVISERTCGTPACHCHRKGPKHTATYLSVRHEGKRVMLCVPERLLDYVKDCVGSHERLQEALEVISGDCLAVFLLKKRRQKK